MLRPLSVLALILTNQNIDRYRTTIFHTYPLFLSLTTTSFELQRFPRQFFRWFYSMTCIGSPTFLHWRISSLNSVCKLSKDRQKNLEVLESRIFRSAESLLKASPMSLRRKVSEEKSGRCILRSSRTESCGSQFANAVRRTVFIEDSSTRRFRPIQMKHRLHRQLLLVKTATDPSAEQSQANNLIMAYESQKLLAERTRKEPRKSPERVRKEPRENPEKNSAKTQANSGWQPSGRRSNIVKDFSFSKS